MPLPTPRLLTTPRITLSAVFLVLLTASTAWAQALTGQLRSAWDDVPLAGIRFVCADTGNAVLTGPDGSFSLPVPSHDGLYRAYVTPPEGARTEADIWAEFVDLSPHWPRTFHIFTPGGNPSPELEFGRPLPHRPEGPPSRPVELPGPPDPPPGVAPLTFTGPLPTHIRVGRRMAGTCSGNPVQRIDTIPLEEYVEGVLVPEIGVFRSLSTGQESSRAVFEAFAIAARTYAVWFWASDPDANFHIDDTACNQRYTEQRQAFIRETVEATAGKILVRASSTSTLDKYEYAASCGRHGSRPAYQDTLVPDQTGVVTCAGSWCGHNTCAAHEVNPAVPNAGRCLVRGICQWGAAERSGRGDPHETILGHYQPNLTILSPADDPTPAPTRLVGFVRFGDITTGPPAPDVLVALDTGERTTTNDQGSYAFDDVAPGLRTLTFSGPTIVTITRDRDVQPHITNWASQAVEAPTPEPTVPAETEPAETEPAETEPAETEPTDTEPAETEPWETEPAETEPAETEPAETEPAEPEPTRTQPPETDPAPSEPARSEPARTGTTSRASADSDRPVDTSDPGPSAEPDATASSPDAGGTGDVSGHPRVHPAYDRDNEDWTSAGCGGCAATGPMDSRSPWLLCLLAGAIGLRRRWSATSASPAGRTSP